MNRIDLKKSVIGLIAVFVMSNCLFAQNSEYLNKAREYFDSGNASLRREEFSKAIDEYTKAIFLTPSAPEFYFNRALAYRGSRQFKLAVKDFERIVDLNPTLPAGFWTTLYFALGTAYQENSEYAKSLTYLTKAINLDPENAAYYNNRANTYIFLKEFDLALVDFNRSISLSPSALAYYGKARLYDAKREPLNAIREYSKAIEIAPSLAEAISNRGMAYQELGQFDKALDDFSKAISLQPGDAIYYSNRGNIYLLKKQFRNAEGDYSKAIEIFPRWAEPYRRRAKVYRELGEIKLAQADETKAIALQKEGFDPVNKIEFIKP